MVQTRKNPGDDLFSRKAALSVSSALESLTSVFGMGTGVASPLVSPGFPASDRVRPAAAPPRWYAGGAVIFNFASGRAAPGDVSRPFSALTLGQSRKRS